MAIFMPESRDYLLTNAQAFTLQWYFFGADHALDVVLYPVAGAFVLPAVAALPKLFLLWLLITVHGGESLCLRAGAG